MTEVIHPAAQRDASPAAVTVGTTTYAVDGDGVIDCPADAVETVAETLADVHDVSPDTLVREEDGPPDDAQPPLDPGDHTVADLRDILDGRDLGDDALDAAIQLEQDGKDRQTAIDALTAAQED